MNSFEKLLEAEGVQPRLFDRWDLTEYPAPLPDKPIWPEPLDGYKGTRGLELWGYHQVARQLLRLMPGARALYRGDSLVMTDDAYDRSFYVQGDLDVSWEGRAPIFEVKTYLPALRLHKEGRPVGPAQGLDWPRRQDYLNEANRTGRPFYVVWVWATEPGIVSMVGERIDLLDWPAHAESLNRLRNVKGAKMAYWRIPDLRTIRDLVEDVATWNGSPFQLELV